jgi:hypothetical protein
MYEYVTMNHPVPSVPSSEIPLIPPDGDGWEFQAQSSSSDGLSLFVTWRRVIPAREHQRPQTLHD